MGIARDVHFNIPNPTCLGALPEQLLQLLLMETTAGWLGTGLTQPDISSVHIPGKVHGVMLEPSHSKI